MGKSQLFLIYLEKTNCNCVVNDILLNNKIQLSAFYLWLYLHPYLILFNAMGIFYSETLNNLYLIPLTKYYWKQFLYKLTCSISIVYWILKPFDDFWPVRLAQLMSYYSLTEDCYEMVSLELTLIHTGTKNCGGPCCRFLPIYEHSLFQLSLFCPAELCPLYIFLQYNNALVTS